MPANEPWNVIVLRHYNDLRARLAGSTEDSLISCRQEPELLDMHGVDAILITKPTRQHRRQLRIDPPSGTLGPASTTG